MGGNVARQLGDGVEIPQLKVFWHVQAKVSGDFPEYFHLLHGVDAKVGLKVEVLFQHVYGVAGFFCDDLLNRCYGRTSGWRCCYGSRRRGRLRCCAHTLGGNVARQLGDGVEIPQLQVFWHVQAKVSGDFSEHFHLLHGIDAKVGLKVEVLFQHVYAVAVFFCDDCLNRSHG